MPSAKSAFGVLAAIALAGALLAGCEGGEGKGAPGGSAAQAPGPSAPSASGPVTFSFYGEDPSPSWNGMQDDIGKQITARTGVTLQASFAAGDPIRMSRMLVSSGTYPDLISAKGNLSQFVDAGAVLDLTDLLDRYGPNIKKVYGDQLNRLRYRIDDPAIYALPTYDGVGQTSFEASGGFELQHRVVQELGYPRIRTLADFENAIRAYLRKHPTDEDGRPNIGLTLNSEDWHFLISVTNPASEATGGSGDGEFEADESADSVTYHYLRPDEKEYFRWLNHMNDIGLLDKESFVQQYDQYQAKIASGRVLGLIDQSWDYGEAEKALKTQGRFDRGYGHYAVTLNESIKDHSFQSGGFPAGYGIAIAKTNPDPVRAIRFLDYLASEEGQVLLNWGIEGEHYEVVGGKRVIPGEVNRRKINDATDFQRETGIGLYMTMAPHYGDGVKDSTGNTYTTSFPEQIRAGYNEVEKDVLSHYGADTWKDLFPDASEFPVKPWGAAWNIPIPADSEIQVLDGKLQDLTREMIPAIVLAEPSAFDGLWDAYVKRLEEAGVHKDERLHRDLIRDRIRLWS